MRLSRPVSRRLAVPLALLLALALSACGGEEPAAEPGTGESEAKETEEPQERITPRDATVPVDSGVVLSRDGLGVADFGDEDEAALEKLIAAMGKPSSVTKWLPMERSLWGKCSGDLVRGAKWGDLWVLFSDESELSQERHLSGWLLGRRGVHGRTALRTAEGIGVDSTLAELRAAYGDRLTLEPFELGQRFFVEATEGEDVGGRILAGTVSGEQNNDRVRAMRGGLPCVTAGQA